MSKTWTDEQLAREAEARKAFEAMQTHAECATTIARLTREREEAQSEALWLRGLLHNIFLLASEPNRKPAKPDDGTAKEPTDG